MAGRGEQTSLLEQQHSPKTSSFKNVSAGAAVTNSLSQGLQAGWLQSVCQGGRVNKSAKAPIIQRILTICFAPGVSYVSNGFVGGVESLR